MRSLIICAGIACLALIISCKQKNVSTTTSKAVTDLASNNLNGNVSQVESDTYLVDSTGKTGPLDSKDIEKYDSSGYEIASISMNGKDSIESQTSIDHNAAGYVTKIQTTGANNEKKSSLSIDYDSLGKYSVAKAYDSTGKLETYYTDITSNEFGDVTGAKGYHPDSTLKMTFENYYDSIYNIGGNSKDSVGKIIYSGIGVLNDKHDLAKYSDTTVTTDPKTKKETTKITSNTYTYQDYDSHGNWTQRTTLDDKGKPTKIVKRIITYRE